MPIKSLFQGLPAKEVEPYGRLMRRCEAVREGSRSSFKDWRTAEREMKLYREKRSPVTLPRVKWLEAKDVEVEPTEDDYKDRVEGSLSLVAAGE